ncbi:MAG: helicase RepA family protein [Treponema sp.]|jgi:hypothetical protein|nr:helicase RepA family protein [Treponema sp.]
MLRIIELEERYLSSVLNGGEIQDITLSQHNEQIHREAKRLRDMGFAEIPEGVISNIGRLKTLNTGHLWAEYIAGMIREEQKKGNIKKLLETVKYGSSGQIIDTIREELDLIAEEKGMNEKISAEKLRDTDFKNTRFIIDGIIPVGLTLLIGAPKMGKTWLTLLMAELMSAGLPLFGHLVRKSTVLYYTLEDSVKRCKYRLNKIGTAWSPNLYFCEAARTATDIINGIRATGAQAVFIDTFMAFSDIEDNNSYSETTRKVRELKRIADTMEVAVILVHHARKDSGGGDWTESAIGSQGLTGAADCIISLKRKRGEDKATLLITGRDISDKRINLWWNDGIWEKCRTD